MKQTDESDTDALRSAFQSIGGFINGMIESLF